MGVASAQARTRWCATSSPRLAPRPHGAQCLDLAKSILLAAASSPFAGLRIGISLVQRTKASQHVSTRLDGLTRKISQLIDLQLDAPTTETRQAYARSVEQAEAERALVARELEELQSRRQVERDVQGLGRRDVVALLDDVFARIRGGLDADDLEKTKAALGGLVHRIELEPGAETLRICYQVEPLKGLNLASPRGFEPLLSP